ncbi:E3 ubiquitin-protein ligase znrf2 isoform X3 [Anarhichas minor]|uniref:E3 ubiquitin-protein ligase znrf2 isoform X3 n=1 Tax=Anarhichas minor TaxID=65739 RepID=UPI003F73F90B
MGAKQSSPAANPAANGRTRAYSGSDLPSSSSSNGSSVSRTTAGGVRYHAYSASGSSGASSSTSQHHGARARYVGGSGARPQSGINIPNSSGAYSSQESGGSSPEEADRGHESPRLLIGSLPAHLSPHLFGGFKCPVCSKFVSSDEMDLHLVLCLTKPRVTYNGTEARGTARDERQWYSRTGDHCKLPRRVLGGKAGEHTAKPSPII